MRFSTSARHRHGSRARSGPVGRTALLRVAAGMLGLALVGSVGAGAVASSPDTVDLPAAAAEATPTPAETTPAAADPAPAAEQLPAADATTPEAPVEEAASEPVAPTKAAIEAPAAPKAPAALALREAPAVQALAAVPPLTCSSGVVYTIDSVGDIREVGTGDGAEREIGAIDGSGALNGFALAKDATSAYAVGVQPVKGNGDSQGIGDMTVYRYDSALGTTTSHRGVQNIPITPGSQNFVMGGINPANGYYYYGRVVNSKLELYAFNTADNSNIGFVGSVAIPADRNGAARGNGDLVFSSDGTMYFVASSGGSAGNANALMQVTSKLPITPSTKALSATLVTNLNVSNEAFNGIAFEGGYLYLDTSSGNFYKVNPSGGAIEKDFGKKLNGPVDMASCQYNNTLQVQKYIVARVGIGDQFTVNATANDKQIGTPGTTAGSTPGLQEGPGVFATSVPISGTNIKITEVGAPGTNLSQYTSSWVCKNGVGTTIANGTGTSGTFVFPAQSNTGVNVTCVFTNQPLSAKVTVTKTWFNAVDGDTASFAAGPETGLSSGSSTAPTNGNVIVASFPQGTKVNVTEVLAAGNKGVYTTTLKCTNAAGASVGTVEAGALKGSFTLGASNVTCAYTNTNTPATVVVEKKWIVDGKPYDNEEQPKGISAELTLTGATAPKWGTVYPGYFAGNTVTIAETTTIDPAMACKVTDSQVTLANGTATSGNVPYAAVLAAGANSYTVTNTVECTTALTLLKFIDNSNGGTLVPGDFTLTATPEVGNALNFDGANTVSPLNTEQVAAGVNHTLSESSDDQLAYLQLNLQRYTGPFNADGSLADPAAWADAAATNVSVQTGKHEVYRFVNASVPTMTLPLTGGTGSIAYLMVGGGLLLLALLVTAWILVRRGKANRA